MLCQLEKVAGILALSLWVLLPGAEALGEEIARGGPFRVVEIAFEGPMQGPKDAPARDIDFWVRWRHESGSPEYKIHGFWDGDGKGGTSGNVFKVRFCLTKTGSWDLVEVHSNAEKLNRQKQGYQITAVASDHPGFWIADPQSPGSRWYMRSDGSHPYIFGNTHYSFLSGYYTDGKLSGNDIAADIEGNAKYFKKLRFSLYGDRYPNPDEKPFFDADGKLTDSGDDSLRPNPRWFSQRVDLAVRTALRHDLIADLILCGPDTKESRSVLRAADNNGDPTPYLKYIAARYGSYPNVWICLCNEFDIKDPKYSEEEIARFGRIIRTYLPYPTPLSVHRSGRTGWPGKFDELPAWNDHQIIQKKIRNLPDSADAIRQTWENPGGNPSAPGAAGRNKPTVNDELSYEGQGDKHSELDTIESHLGAFLGGGYATTGEKPGNKLGQYFRGRFDPAEHASADNLKYLREVIDRNVAFWRMSPGSGIFSNLDAGSRGLAWDGREYVLGTNKACKGIVADLPQGTWTVRLYDIVGKREQTLNLKAQGRFTFDAPDSRAVLFHFRKN